MWTKYLPDAKRVGAVTSWLHRDHLASVRLVTDAACAQAERANYLPFGQQFPALTQSKGWLGEKFDPETGLQYLHARYYDPVLARFLTPDTLWARADSIAQRAFRAGLIKAGKLDPKLVQDAHHIVMKAGQYAAPARKILDDFKIDINAIENGVGLSTHFKNRAHSERYAVAVNRRLRGLMSEDAVVGELDKIGKELSSYDKEGKSLENWAEDQMSNSAKP